MSAYRVAAALLLFTGCKEAAAPDPAPAAPDPAPAAPDLAPVEGAAASSEGTCVEAPRRGHGGALGWREDDLEGALACGRAHGRPVVIDLWAPWCHTCLSMQQTVLTDPKLAPYARRFEWVALDTDRPENEAAVGRYPPLAWPTFYVVDSTTGAIAARHVGGASVEQVIALLDAGLKAVNAELPDASPSVLARDAAQAEAKADYTRAHKLYAAALAEAPKTWPRRPDVLVSAIRAHVRAEDCAGALELAARAGLDTGRAASAADFAYYARRCATTLDFPRGSKATLRKIVAHVEAAVDDGGAMSVDDRSDALRILREIELSLGQRPRANRLARRQRELLDRAIAEAPPTVAMTYNWPAAEVYAFLGEPEALIPVIERNMEALPRAYDPPYRLAWLLLQAKRPKDALPHAEAALERVYGPREAQVYRLLADIHAAKGDASARIAALKGAVEVYEGLPAGQRDAKKLAAAREALAEAN